MTGIKHKESLPAQGHVKRRRVDAPPPPTAEDNTPNLDSDTKETAEVDRDAIATAAVAEANTRSVSDAAAPKAAAANATSGNSSSDDESDSDSEDEIARENARLAQLREQRSRRQEQSAPARGGTGGSSSASGSAAGGASAASPSTSGTTGTNSYDHDVLFRNPAWRTSAKSATAEEKRKEKWNAVANRTQESAAHRHFMKNFFK